MSCERGLTHARPARSADHPSESPSGKLSQVKVTQRPLNKTPSPRKTLVMPWHPQRGSGALPGVRLQTLCWFAHQSAVCSGYVPAELYLHLPHRKRSHGLAVRVVVGASARDGYCDFLHLGFQPTLCKPLSPEVERGPTGYF